jgi:threonine/homoserine/homoserine lactone efflux protein
MAPPLFALAFYWHLPLLIVLVSLVYSATRYDRWGPIVDEALRWGVRLTGFLFAIIGVLYVVAVLV